MTFTLHTPLDFVESSWSGGATTQLYIAPEGTTYSERNFDTRISTAKVESETSTFTRLPGYHRKLMVLNGNIQLNHQGHPSKILRAFDVDSFEGEWSTEANGTCTDFNVMTAKGIESHLTCLLLAANKESEILLENPCKILFLFSPFESINVTLSGEPISLEQHNLLEIQHTNGLKVSVCAAYNTHVVLITIH